MIFLTKRGQYRHKKNSQSDGDGDIGNNLFIDGDIKSAASLNSGPCIIRGLNVNPGEFYEAREVDTDRS